MKLTFIPSEYGYHPFYFDREHIYEHYEYHEMLDTIYHSDLGNHEKALLIISVFNDIIPKDTGIDYIEGALKTAESMIENLKSPICVD